MFKMYNTDIETNITTETKKYTRGNWINMVSPSDEEIKTVCQNINIQEDFIRYALDPEEKARIDIEEDDNTILFIIDTPIMDIESGAKVYSTMPIGVIFVRDDYLITVSLHKNPILESLTKNKMKNIITYKKSRMLLQLFYSNSAMFLNLLKKINKETEIAENVLKNSMKNKELLKLLSLEKGLVYFTTSLKSNEIVMEKTMRGNLIKLYEEDEDILEDSIIENKQAIEMAKIYSDILAGTMDAYASIISNNLNGVMKYLTSITIILAIPTMISSYWGMNVGVPLQNNPFGFVLIVLFSLLIGIIVSIWLKKKGLLD
jgi:magnesium transporter